MSKVIVYNENNHLMVLHPGSEITSAASAILLGQKDVPTGLPFKVMEHSDIPTGRDFRDSWEISNSELTDGVGQ